MSTSPKNQTLEMVKYILRLSALITAIAVAHLTRAQPEKPPLAKLKAAAEAGNAEAQSKFGDAYRSSLEEANALGWYRKAAAQGVAHAQAASFSG